MEAQRGPVRLRSIIGNWLISFAPGRYWRNGTGRLLCRNGRPLPVSLSDLPAPPADGRFRKL
jgi:hypothetical protein